MAIRSKHNNLLNYFIHDRRDLSPAYVRKCEEFFNTFHSADNEKFKRQASKRVGPPNKESGSKLSSLTGPKL